MELTQKTFQERLKFIEDAIKADNETIEILQASLREKGVECSIIVPLLEIVLEFNALKDIQYEQESERMHGQRFDFLLDGIFLIEAKSLNAQLIDHQRQIQKYILDNPSIEYGILTNGIDYQVWLQRTYIENTSNSKLPDHPNVINLLEVSLEEDGSDFVFKVLRSFARSHYKEVFKTIALIAAYYAGGGRGRPPILHEDREINEKLRERIRRSVSVETGIYYEAIKTGQMHPGEKLVYKNSWVSITVELTKTGTVVLHPGGANVVDMVGAIQNGWEGLINLIKSEWSKEDAEFENPLLIIKRALNRHRLHEKEKYNFEPIK